MNMFHRNRYNAETAVFIVSSDTKNGCTCPKAHATVSYISFYYYCLSKLTFIL